MFRKSLFAFVMLFLCIAFVTADTVKGKITKIDDKSVTITNKQNKDGKTFTIAKDCKVCKSVLKDDKESKEEVKDGLKAEVFTKISDKGIGGATLTTNDKGEVTEILLAGKKKKAAN